MCTATKTSLGVCGVFKPYTVVSEHWFLKAGSHVSQASLEYAAQHRMTLNF